jgi:hypothetical protein
VGLVFGQHHRTVGQLGDGLAQRSQDLLAIGIALGDQAGPTPAGDLPDASAQRALAEGGSAELLPRPTDRPGLGLGEQPQDALGQAGPPSGGRPARGRSASPLVPWAL